MEKINKEELMKKLNLTEEDLEKVAGGGNARKDVCYEGCNQAAEGLLEGCIKTGSNECSKLASDFLWECIMGCEGR